MRKNVTKNIKEIKNEKQNKSKYKILVEIIQAILFTIKKSI